MTCSKCSAEVGCGCNLTNGLCKKCLREKTLEDKKLKEKQELIKKLTKNVSNN